MVSQFAEGHLVNIPIVISHQKWRLPFLGQTRNMATTLAPTFWEQVGFAFYLRLELLLPGLGTSVCAGCSGGVAPAVFLTAARLGVRCPQAVGSWRLLSAASGLGVGMPSLNQLWLIVVGADNHLPFMESQDASLFESYAKHMRKQSHQHGGRQSVWCIVRTST